MAQRTITELARKHDETLVFGLYLPGDGALTFTARADGQKKLLYRIEMNTKLSLVWGASGKAALAYLPEERIASILAREGNSPASGAQPPALQDLLAELAEGRTEGYFITTGRNSPAQWGSRPRSLALKGYLDRSA
jgi:DNA-binding IclR family transcriptional regulator